MAEIKKITDYGYPDWLLATEDHEKWRLTYAGGDAFKNRYLTQFSRREDNDDFQTRKAMSPIPTYAKAAINDIRNSIFQRMRDIVRRGGSTDYQKAVAGLSGGVDRRGSTMNAFLGMKVLTDLLVMGKVGVFVDNPVVKGPKLSDAVGVRPYLYSYKLEDIVSFSCMKEDDPSEFQAVLLRDTSLSYDGEVMLPTARIERYRRMWINETTGKVNLQFYDSESHETGGPIELELNRIPFVLLDLGDSLIKDVCQHQIALLNLLSSDVNYALLSNFPFYVEQRDLRAAGSHLKQVATADGTATAGGQGADDVDRKTGASQGVFYDVKMNQPAFINPSAEPLRASIELRDSLKNEVRELINLAVMTVATRASAESRQLDNSGLEAGLSYIGLVLENAERKIAEYWAAYEERNESNRQVPTIRYPDRYSLKSDEDRIKESTDLSKLMQSVPGQTVKREIGKSIVQALLGGKVSVETIEKINSEIDECSYTTSDSDTILASVEKGLCGEKTGSMALGFGPEEYKLAREDHAARVARIAEAQGIGTDPGARGVKDLSVDPNAGSAERKSATDVTMKSTTEPPVRGEAK
jgi:alkylhydroperoxidase/carboxymuconolactone decarboxylase family protein YurZ